MLIASRQRFEVRLSLITNDYQLRCGRERPACSRCTRLDATCHFPNPPNRRGPRSHRNGSRQLQRTTEPGREQTHPRCVVPQRPNIEPGLQQTPNCNNLLGGVTIPDNDAEADDTSGPLATETPVLSDVRINGRSLLILKGNPTITDGSLVLFNTIACDKLIRSRFMPCPRPATVTANCSWTFFVGNILLSHI